MRENPLNVLLIEPHTWWREIVATSIARWPEYRLVSAVASGMEGIERAMALQPAVVVFDFHLPDLDTADLVGALQTLAPVPRFVLLTAEPDEAIHRFADQFGLAGVVRKNTRVPEHLPAALGEIRAGRSYLPNEWQGALATSHRA